MCSAAAETTVQLAPRALQAHVAIQAIRQGKRLPVYHVNCSIQWISSGSRWLLLRDQQVRRLSCCLQQRQAMLVLLSLLCER